MEYSQFIKNPLCKPLLLPEEECPQDLKEWNRLQTIDRQRQYTDYLKLHAPADKPASTEETRVLERLLVLTKKNLSGGEKSLGESRGVKTLVKTEIDSEFETQHLSSIRDSTQKPSNAKFDKVAYQRDYMRQWRAAKKLKEKK